MSFEKLVSLVEHRALYYASIESLRRADSFEASLPRRTHERRMSANLRGIDPNSIVGYGDGPDAFRRSAYVSCWCLQEHEDHLLWRVYSADRGVAIQSTCQRLINSTPAEDMIGLVKYADFERDDVPDGNEVLFAALKRREYAGEYEVRLIRLAFKQRGSIWLGSDGRRREPSDKRVAAWPAGFLDDVDLDQLVEAIYVSPFAESYVLDAVAAYLERAGFRDRLRDSALRTPPPHDRVPVTAQQAAFLRGLERASAAHVDASMQGEPPLNQR